MAIPHWPTYWFVVFLNEVVDHFRFIWNFCDAAHDFEEFSERLLAWILDLNFVGDAAKESVIDQVFWLEIGTENDQLVERNLDLFAVANGQIVVAFFERHDPTIEQFVDAHPLASEVIDQKYATIAFKLQGRIADIGF